MKVAVFVFVCVLIIVLVIDKNVITSSQLLTFYPDSPVIYLHAVKLNCFRHLKSLRMCIRRHLMTIAPVITPV